jgi:hypothetical protein
MFGSLPTVRVWEIVGGGYGTKTKSTVFVNTVMAHVTKNDAVVDIAHPCISKDTRTPQLIRNDMMSVVKGVDETSAAVSA